MKNLNTVEGTQCRYERHTLNGIDVRRAETGDSARATKRKSGRKRRGKKRNEMQREGIAESAGQGQQEPKRYQSRL